MSETIKIIVKKAIAIQKTTDSESIEIMKKYSKNPNHNTNGDGIIGNIMPAKLAIKSRMIIVQITIFNMFSSKRNFNLIMIMRLYYISDTERNHSTF